MESIPLQAIPNQSLTYTSTEGVRYALNLRTVGDITLVDIDINGTRTISGKACVPGRPLLPYQYQEGQGGNFAFYTPNDELPYYESFGVTHDLVYVTATELTAQRGGA